MEENINSTKKSNLDEEETLKKASNIENIKNNHNKQIFSNEIKNENIIESSKSNEKKDDVNLKIPVKSEPSKDAKIKPKNDIPIEKKPFNEFVNDHLFPTLINELKNKGIEVEEINLKKTFRPISGDKCWVIYCELKDICNFWLSFEKDDITSLKSFSLCGSNQKPSVIESFLIDEKRITLKLIISRILQRLNGQKLIGIN